MMNSAQENEVITYPLSVQIDVSDRYIEDKLRRVMMRETAVDGGEDVFQLDGRRLGHGDRIDNILATGREVTHLFERGFSMHVAMGEAAHDWSITASASEDCMRLRYAAQGDAQYTADRGSVVDEDSSCTFIVQPAGASLTGHYRRGVVYRYCSIDVSRTFLAERLGIAQDRLPAPVTSSWQRQEAAFGRIELERPTLGLLQRLFAICSDDTWARIEAQAIALLVINQVFSTWRDNRRSGAILVRLKTSERAALSRLRAEAEQRCPFPLSIQDAQAICGLNRNKIHYGFKEMYGTSLQRYCTDLRMQRAAHLLKSSALTIAEIGEQLGFSEPTNFTAAFRHHFGRLPSEMRKAD
jgi:AraC-like DNA-binding protein